MNTGHVVWFTGLPQSGKSTLAAAVRERVLTDGGVCCVLDGDEIRAAIVPKHGYSQSDRADFYRTLGNLAGVIARQGLLVLVPATGHRRVFRDYARQRAPRFLEVYVATAVEECIKRDVKQLYDHPENLPGRGLDYEPPLKPDVTASGGVDPVAVARIVAAVANARGQAARGLRTS